MFELYKTTVDKMWGTQYLSLEFFKLLSKSPVEFRKYFIFIVAFAPRSNQVVAGTINFVKGEKFYGRYLLLKLTLVYVKI
jgi:predicted N-acyltransferase